MTLHTSDVRINALIKNALLKEFEEVLGLKSFGELCQYEENVEKKFAAFTGTRFCTIVDSGTTALKLGLCLLGVEAGDEVIVPVSTFPSTALPIVELGAIPVFVDMNESYTIDDTKIEEVITPKTKAILPVHLFGHLCNMDAINAIAKKHDLKVIEDACQSHGSNYKGKKAGALGDIGSFSFTMHKSIPGFTGGAITYDNIEYAKQINDYKWVTRDNKQIIKYGRAAGTLSTLEIANINIKIKLFDLIKKSKDATKEFYTKNLKNDHVRIVEDMQDTHSVRQHVVAEVDNADELLAFLKTKDIDLEKAYHPLLHEMKIFEEYCKGKEFPIASRICPRSILLPTSALITNEELTHVIESINEFYK